MRVLRLAGVAATALAAAGCTLTALAPKPSPGPAMTSPSMTGSLGPAALTIGEAPPSAFAFLQVLDAEDVRRARAALAVALDPQGNGTRVKWDNPATGAHGSVTPLAGPYVRDDLICRAFEARLERPGEDDKIAAGHACRQPGGEWTIGSLTAMPGDPGRT